MQSKWTTEPFVWARPTQSQRQRRRHRWCHFLLLFSLAFVDQSVASTSTASSKPPQLGQRCNYHTSVKINAGHAHSRPSLLTQLRGQRTNICVPHSVEKVSKQCSLLHANTRVPWDPRIHMCGGRVCRVLTQHHSIRIRRVARISSKNRKGNAAQK